MDNNDTVPRSTPTKSIVAILCIAALGILAHGVFEVASERRSLAENRTPQGTSAETGAPLVIPPGVPVVPEVLSVDDAEAHNGAWFILDGTARRIHRLSPAGELLGSFGRQGEGPGEFPGRPVALAVHGDTIAVMEHDGRRLHLFDPEGGFLAGRLVRLDQCPVSAVGDLVSLPLGLVFLVTCTQTDFGQQDRVILEARSGFLQTLVTRGSNEPDDVMLGGFLWNTLSPHPDGFVFGSNVDGCLGVYDGHGEVLGSACHDWLNPLPVPDELVNAVRDKFSARPDVRWRLPESFFPFFGVFVTPDDRWIYRVLASDEPESYVLATRDRELSVPRARYVFVDGASALLGWEDLQGTRIAVHPLEH